MPSAASILHLLVRFAARLRDLLGGVRHRLREQRRHETCLHLVAQLSWLDDPAARPAAELVSRLTAPSRPAWDPADPLEALWRLPARRPQFAVS